jgi:hypothetical protein
MGGQRLSFGGRLIRTVGLAQAQVKIGMMNLVYNIQRFVPFERGVAALG